MAQAAQQLPEENLSSNSFIDRLRRRERQAVDKIVRNYTGQLHRAARGMRLNDDDAAEIVQRTWTTFFEVVPKFEGRSHIRTYVFGILYNKVAEFRRERAKFLKNDPIDEVLESSFDNNGKWAKPPLDPEKFLLAAEKLDWLKACLDELPHQQNSALRLKQLQGFSTQEVCKILDVSGTNLGVLIHRARNALRLCLESRAERGRGRY